jgi:hypothetical protein
MGGELRLAHIIMGTTEIIRRVCVDHLRQRKVELLVEQLQSGQGSGHQPRSMIATPTADDLLLFGTSENIVVIPYQFDVGFIRIRPRQPEIDLGHALGRAVQYHLGQGDARLGPVADIGVVIGQFARLIGNRFGNLLTPIADIHAVKTCESIQKSRPVTVGDVAILGRGDDPLRNIAARELGQMG